MPRQRKSYRRDVHVFPEDFPQRLERLKDESGLTWSELAGLAPAPSPCWRQGARPNALHLLALLELATSLEVAQLLPLGRTGGRSLRHPTVTARTIAPG